MVYDLGEKVLYVAGSGNMPVSAFWSGKSTPDYYLGTSGSRAMALDGNGDLFVANGNNTVSEFGAQMQGVAANCKTSPRTRTAHCIGWAPAAGFTISGLAPAAWPTRTNRGNRCRAIASIPRVRRST